MNVFKFGGASISTLERIENLPHIISGQKTGELVIVVSAMGKTTNALEQVAKAFFSGSKEEALHLFQAIKQDHLSVAEALLVESYTQLEEQLSGFFTEVEWLLHDKAVRGFDYYYDQIVCIGELLSSAIVAAYLNEAGIENTWLDVRDFLVTDNNFRDANVNYKTSAEKIAATFKDGIYITQGFVGCTDENESTTLGREGSDYSAALFANFLHAESVTIWKDVEGVMSADPKNFEDAELIAALSYNEAIEMAYYGAQVIHPKTIKPLQNQNIPLYVKSFLHPQHPGTIISNRNVHLTIPIIIIKRQQALLQLSTHDFSFIEKDQMMILYQLFEELDFKPNLFQKGSISIQICIDDHVDKQHRFSSSAALLFHVRLRTRLTLLTIRHYNKSLLEKMTASRKVVLLQQTNEMVQVLYEDADA